MRRKIQKPLALLLAFAMMFCMVPAAGFAADNGDSEAAVERIAGQNRWETAALTAVEKYGTNDTVIIARGDDDGNFADGLAASYLAKVKDAPILLTNPNSLPDATEKAIKDLNAQNAIVLGGELAVSEAVVNELEGLELEVERIEGGDRFGTAAAIAKAGGNADTALVVSGYAPADSLVAGPVAFNNDYPVLLVQKDSVPPATEDAIEELGIDNILVVGGETVISNAVYNALDADDRYAGYTRIDTSVVVADELFEEPETFTIVGRQDKNLADAVGAAVLGNPILYVGNDISDIEEYLNEVITADTQFVILGGTNAVNEAVENALNELAPEEEGLVVESVSAINPTTIKVVFNQEVEELVRTDVVVRNVKTSDRQYVKEVKLAEDKKSAEVVFYDALVTKNTYKVVVDEAEKEFDYVVGDAAKIEAETVQVVKPIEQTTNLKDVVEFKVLDANGLDITDITEVEFESTASKDGKTIDKLDAGKQTFVYVVVKDKDGKELAKSERITVKAEDAKAVKLLDYAVAKDAPNFEKDEIVKIVRSDDKDKSLFLNLEDQFGESIGQDGAKFESLNKEVALVDQNSGKITPLKVGTVDVRVTVDDVNEIIQITVEEAAKVASLELDKAEINLSDKLAEGQDVKVTVKDQYGEKFDSATNDVTFEVKEGKEIITVEEKSANGPEETFTVKPVEGKEGKAVVEFSYKADEETFKTTLTVNVAKADVVDNYVVEGFEKELDKYAGTNEKPNTTSMTLKVFGVDANGVKTGEVTENLTIELYKGEDEVATDGALTGSKIDATKLEKDTEYKVVVKVGTLTVFEDTFTVVDTSPAEVEPVVEQIGNKITIESLNHDVDVNEALKALFEIDGKALTNEEEVYVYSSDNMSVVEVTEGIATALKNGEATLIVTEITRTNGDVLEVDNFRVDVTVDAPEIVEAKAESVEDAIVLTVKAKGKDLTELEVDHSLEGKLPEFSVPAEDLTGKELADIIAGGLNNGENGKNLNFSDASVKYEDGTWTINFGKDLTNLIKTIAGDSNKISFYLVVKDDAGNQSGHMGDEGIPSNYKTVECDLSSLEQED